MVKYFLARRFVAPLVTILLAAFLVGCLDQNQKIDKSQFAWEYKIPPSPAKPGVRTISSTKAFFAGDKTFILEKHAYSKKYPFPTQINLTLLSAKGRPTWTRILFERGTFEFGWKLFPIKTQPADGKLYFGLYKSPNTRKKRLQAVVSILEFDIATRQLRTIASQELPYSRSVTGAWRRKDGYTVFSGKNRDAKKDIWIAAIDGQGKLAWSLEEIKIAGQEALRPLQIKKAGFTRQGNFRYLSRKRVFLPVKDQPSITRLDWAIYEHVIDSTGKTVSAKGLFALRKSDIQSKRLKWISMRLGPVINLLQEPKGGGLLLALNGWLQGKYAAVRLAKIDSQGKYVWTKPLLEVSGDKANITSLISTDTGQGFVIAKQKKSTNRWESLLFKVDENGQILRKKTFDGFTVSSVVPDPSGGFLLSLITYSKNSKNKTTSVTSYAKMEKLD